MTRALPQREECSTARIVTRFGSIYAHITHANGRVTGVHISHPQKHQDTAVGEALEALGLAVTEEIAAINGVDTLILAGCDREEVNLALQLGRDR